jgi:aminoglycoside phosphotransferase (APT) family kinase protein
MTEQGADPGSAGEAVLIPVLPQHRFDEAALRRYLEANLPGFTGPLQVLQFQGGQSNPTFCLRTPAAEYVLRKKPSGTLLPSAHAVDREARVMRALAATEVPVPHVHLLCADETVIGQMFYVMDRVPGRIFANPLLPDCDASERAAIYDDMNRVLAALHRVDWRAAGLEGFGKPHGYVGRQIERWVKQYRAAVPEDVRAMERLMQWLPARIPADERTSIVHGDYRLQNVIIHPREPQVVAVLDWELATLGHPLADLAYNLLSRRLPPEADGIEGRTASGIPNETAYVARYCQRAGFKDAGDLEFFVVFSLFRLAAILAGVYRRALDGNAAHASAMRCGERYRLIAARAWALAQQIG